MKTLYILDAKQQIIGKISYTSIANENYFRLGLAHAFDTNPNNIITKEDYNKRNNIYLCSVCDETPVDVLDGYDTCPDCIGKI